MFSRIGFIVRGDFGVSRMQVRSSISYGGRCDHGRLAVLGVATNGTNRHGKVLRGRACRRKPPTNEMAETISPNQALCRCVSTRVLGKV